MSKQEADGDGRDSVARDPDNYPGYPSATVREEIRKWGSPEDWKLWQKWEEFIRGESDQKPASLAAWLPDHELAERERQREIEKAEHRRKTRLNRRAEFVMGEQLEVLRHALGRGYVRSPLVFAHPGYPARFARIGGPEVKKLGMWGGLAWRQRQEYVKAWDEFMRGVTESPPAPKVDESPPGSAIELENKGYVGNDPPPKGFDRWPDGK